MIEVEENIILRNVTEKDSAAIRFIAQQCYPLDIHTPYTYWVVCKYFNNISFVLENDGNPIGYVMAIETSTCVLFWQIAIIEHYRGKKLSKLLIDPIVKYAKSKDKCIQVTISPENKRSYNCFESYCNKNGYTINASDEFVLKDLSNASFESHEIIYNILENNK